MPLSDRHLDAWRAVVTAQAAVTERLQKAFAATDLPPLSWFELLWAISRSTDGPPRMSDLAERLTLSRGGITKLVDRLEDAGYVERVSCSDDRRSLSADLTEAGERMVEEMRAVYRSEVDRYLGGISGEEAEVIAGALARVTGRTCDAEGAGLDAGEGAQDAVAAA
jgi:DNA-binding MarR family transcriptional regulator